MSGMIGLRRCSGCLVEEAQLDIEEVELAGLRFGRELRPLASLGCGASSVVRQTGLHLLSWESPRPALL